MAKTFSPVTPVSCNYTVDTKSSTLKSANIRVNEVPASFRILKQKTNGAGATVLPPLTDGVRVVTAAEYKQAAECLAQAFGQDDVARYFIDVPDREHWTEEQKWALHVEILEYITYAHILKGLVTTVGDFEAVALWMPPGQNMDDYLTIFRSGMWRLNYRLSSEGKRRFFDEFLPLLHDTMHSALGEREHDAWYLVYLGTKPSGRGKGHARKLIEHVTKLADREGRPCYLESSNETNPPIYRKFGFEETRRINLQRGGRNIPLDIMVREPVGMEPATHNHLQYGRNYTGLYPKWGTANSDGSINKVHLIGHSMGGQTIRMLAQLLEHGTTGAPIKEDPSSHTLFKGGKSWVHSITTISTPNQGTTLGDGFSVIGDPVKDLLAGVLSVVGILGDSAKMVYDAKLDQWGITTKQSGETVQKYLDRVFSSKIFDPSFKDVCLWSLSTGGAKEEATWVKTLSDVYYYSYATIDTYNARDLLLRKISLPNLLTMLLPLDPLAVFIGGRYAPDNLKLSTDWQPNDGVVPTISMASDGVGATVTFAGSSQLGKWNKMPQLNRLDHLGVIGVTLHTQVLDLYEGHAALLYALPSSNSRRLADPTDAVVKLDTAIVELTAATTSVETKSDLESLCQSPKNSYAQSYCTKMLESAPTRRLRG